MDIRIKCIQWPLFTLFNICIIRKMCYTVDLHRHYIGRYFLMIHIQCQKLSHVRILIQIHRRNIAKYYGKILALSPFRFLSLSLSTSKIVLFSFLSSALCLFSHGIYRATLALIWQQAPFPHVNCIKFMYPDLHSLSLYANKLEWNWYAWMPKPKRRLKFAKCECQWKKKKINEDPKVPIWRVREGKRATMPKLFQCELNKIIKAKMCARCVCKITMNWKLN